MSKSILVVDDEKPLANALKIKLETLNFNVLTAHSGSEAISLINENNFDLILLDILMPNTDGWGVLEAVQSKGLKVIVTSNLSQEEDITRAKQLGAYDFMVKSESSLSDIVDKVALTLE